MNKYQVIVGNIGTVYDGNNRKDADAYFRTYREQSQTHYGRAAGESVVLMTDGEIEREWAPPEDDYADHLDNVQDAAEWDAAQDDGDY